MVDLWQSVQALPSGFRRMTSLPPCALGKAGDAGDRTVGPEAIGRVAIVLDRDGPQLESLWHFRSWKPTCARWGWRGSRAQERPPARRTSAAVPGAGRAASGRLSSCGSEATDFDVQAATGNFVRVCRTDLAQLVRADRRGSRLARYFVAVAGVADRDGIGSRAGKAELGEP